MWGVEVDVGEGGSGGGFGMGVGVDVGGDIESRSTGGILKYIKIQPLFG